MGRRMSASLLWKGFVLMVQDVQFSDVISVSERRSWETRWIGIIEFTPALSPLNVDVRGKGIKYKLSNISEVFEVGIDV